MVGTLIPIIDPLVCSECSHHPGGVRSWGEVDACEPQFERTPAGGRWSVHHLSGLSGLSGSVAPTLDPGPREDLGATV